MTVPDTVGIDSLQEQAHRHLLMHFTRNGAFGSRAEATKLIERFRQGRIDATYYGHVHSYYAYANGEIPAFISGGGGAIPERMDGIGRNYLTVDIDPVKQVVETALVRID